MQNQQEKLPSGKSIIRILNDDGSIYKEMHSYGELAIGVSFDFRNGVKIEESYFVNRRMVGRKTYEKARAKYLDMPAPDITQEDWSADLLKKMAQQKKQHNAEIASHVSDAGEARKLDAFCNRVLKKGKRAEAIKWIQSKNHTLGELNWARSKSLVKKLSTLGCINIFACEIDSYEDGMENTGHLVIELPKSPQKRKNIVKQVNHLAMEQGYEGPPDDGQRYAYVKLD